jgi:hypothetical protein
MRGLLILLLAGAGSEAVCAAEIRQLDVERADGRVTVNSEILIAAPQAAVFAALSDYEKFSELSDRYLESGFVEPAGDGAPRIHTVVEGCVLFFCQTIERYARLELTPDSRIESIVDAEMSDLKFGHERWELSAEDEGTRVVYQHELEPDFWVPPVIGVWAIRRILAGDSLKAATRIEQLALSQT